ncbi:MAG: hypothetical protein K2P51_02360 [Rhabdochlamydiaceae bacterium]|nr:hypothetical protein [Rhabdochlamydiaceae bacterium]
MPNPLTALCRLFTSAPEQTPPPGTFTCDNPPRPVVDLSAERDTLHPMQPESIQTEPLLPQILQWFAHVRTRFQTLFAHFTALFRTTSEPQQQQAAPLLADQPPSDDEDGFEIPDDNGDVSVPNLRETIQNRPVANVSLISDIWNELKQPGFALFSGLLVGSPQQNVIEAVRSSTENVVFLPAVVENRGFGSQLLPEHLRQHFVVFVVNKQTGSIGYFDPQGKEISKEQRSLLHTEITPNMFVENLRAALNLQGKTQSNLQQIQTNSTECGFYGSLFMGRMAAGHSFDALTGQNSRDLYFGGDSGAKVALLDQIRS